MKTILLFSSIFYLLGLKVGNTVEILKRLVAPVKSIMHSPAPQPVKLEKSYFYKPEETRVVKKVVKRKSDTASVAKTPLAQPENTSNQSIREELKVH
jgi:hypothetical protein